MPFSDFQLLRRALVRALPVTLLAMLAPVALASEQPTLKCTRLGQTVVYRGKKFTCIRVNKKLVWDKGVLIKVASSPTPSATWTSSPAPIPSSTNKVESPTPSPAVTSNPQEPVRIFFAKSSQVIIGKTVVISGFDPFKRPLSVAFTRTSSDLIALEAFCTHGGCIVRPEGKILACPCHGSTFDAFTGALGSPSQQALTPLYKLLTEESNGEIFLIFN